MNVLRRATEADGSVIRLLVIDDHTLLRLGLTYTIATCPDISIVGEGRTAADARRLIIEQRPTVVTLDVRLGDGDGVELARELRVGYPGLGLVLLADGDDDLLFRAMESGLSGYVLKSAPSSEVVAAIRHARAAPTSFTASGVSAALAGRRSRPSLLSVRERQVLGLLRDGATLPQIAVTLSVSESTVKTYVSRLYEKLGASNRAQALMTAVNRGLLFAGSGTSFRPVA